jgi:dynein intermediate chain 2
LPHQCETKMSTEKAQVTSSSMWHSEGGWPKDVDVTEPSDMSRFRKRTEKEGAFQNAVAKLGPVATYSMVQNNTVNVYEKYDVEGKGNNVEIGIQSPSTTGVAVFQDPSLVKRPVSLVAWHPDGSRFAVSYAAVDFQDKQSQNPNSLSFVSVSNIIIGLDFKL